MRRAWVQHIGFETSPRVGGNILIDFWYGGEKSLVSNIAHWPKVSMRYAIFALLRVWATSPCVLTEFGVSSKPPN